MVSFRFAVRELEETVQRLEDEIAHYESLSHEDQALYGYTGWYGIDLARGQLERTRKDLEEARRRKAAGHPEPSDDDIRRRWEWFRNHTAREE